MKVRNAYPEKPEVPYLRTSVEMAQVIGFLHDIFLPVPVETAKEVKRAAYVFFRIESGNGKSGVNNNYAGIQADGGRWPSEYDSLIAATSVTPENKTGKMRRFVVFNDWKDSLQFTISNTLRRGMYIGGETFRISQLKVGTPEMLFTAYKREWVTGNALYTPGPAETAPFLSMYRQAEKIFI